MDEGRGVNVQNIEFAGAESPEKGTNPQCKKHIGPAITHSPRAKVGPRGSQRDKVDPLDGLLLRARRVDAHLVALPGQFPGQAPAVAFVSTAVKGLAGINEKSDFQYGEKTMGRAAWQTLWMLCQNLLAHSPACHTIRL